MRINFSAYSIRSPIPAVVLFVVGVALGLFAFATMPITRFPNVDVPVVSVTVTETGAAPAQLESQVTRKVEDAIAGVSGVDHIQSTVVDGQSSTSVIFHIEINADRALNDVKDAIARIRSDLPGDVNEPIVSRVNVVDLPIVSYSVSAPSKSIEETSWYVDNTVIPALQGLEGVSQAVRIGGVDREIHVSLDPVRLGAFGVTAAQVSQQLKATNVDLAGGRITLAGQEQSLRTLAGARTLADLAATRVALPGGRAVKLSDLGTVSDAYAEPRTFARLDGRPVVARAVSRATGASDVDVAAAVAAKVAALGKADPDFSISLFDTQVDYTFGNYRSAMETLVEGALLSVLVVFLFLRDWRATLISATALPLSVLPTFFFMKTLGFSLNLVSLLALTLATGILVDDAIVEIENISRHMRMGKSPWRASLEAADEIGLAVIAISLTIVAIFAPVSFMSGIAGQYFKQFGLTVAISVLVSLLVARLVTPMLAAYFLRAPRHEEAR
ncbi:MAG: efflux RND transporter permease subunit, partial [Hyphomicrobiales bacterium]|nr:efflux RND transporter permease subunit [Hyphomicrobiales bacterium]